MADEPLDADRTPAFFLFGSRDSLKDFRALCLTSVKVHD
jgi:hypothetical protein